MKYSTQCTTSTTTFTPSTSTSGVRGKTTWSGWNAIANFSRQSTSFFVGYCRIFHNPAIVHTHNIKKSDLISRY